jgi:Cu(I)/Ag(I) efflux system membrane fusion protein
METRTVSTSGANAQKTAESGGLTESQQQALTAFLTLADGISQALAADDLETFNQRAAQLAAMLPSLQKELAPPHPLSVLIARLAGASQAKPAPDLGEARSQFLPLSTAAVELARALRKTGPEFSGLKVYHCPMAPQPGLWVQAKGPLANPFFGPKMLKCGEEVIE